MIAYIVLLMHATYDFYNVYIFIFVFDCYFMIAVVDLSVRKTINKLANFTTKRTLDHLSSSRPSKVAKIEPNSKF